MAVLQYFVDRWFLGGRAGIQVWLGQSAAHPESYKLIYDAREGWPDVEWADEQHLVFTLGAPKGAKVSPPIIPEPPFIARRSAGDVEILYRVASEISERSYRRSLQNWEQRSREGSWRYYPINLRYVEMDDSRSHYKGAHDAAQKHWMKYLAFRSWILYGEENPARNPRVSENISYDAEDVSSSPDGSYVARIIPAHSRAHSDGSMSYNIVVGRNDGSREQDVVVFAALDGLPAITWADDNNLVITISHLSRIQTSLHRADDVAISYNIAERLREVRFRKDLESWRQQEEESERKRPTGKSFEANMDELDRRIQQQMKYYVQFQAWVLTNIPEGER